ncbi:MAG: hypothetical protein ACLGH0_13995, partial [Thermoanaerobaculia bacterium]
MKKSASAEEVFAKPPRSPRELADPGVSKETVLRIEGARVVFADHALLQHDFPQLRGRRTKEIDTWLLRNAALISTSQAAQTTVNTDIPTNGEAIAYRPPLYGRALVAPVDDGPGLLDLKGTGVAPGRAPVNLPHSNGLLALGEAIANIAFRDLIELILRRAGTQLYTVREYALLDLGFEVRDLLGMPTPAGMQVRQAHRRPLGGAELPNAGSVEQQIKLQIELLLRHYGVTSTSLATSFVIDDSTGVPLLFYANKPLPPHPPDQVETFFRRTGYRGGRMVIEGVNVQLTRESAVAPARAWIVDFGHYSVRERFEHAMVSLVRDRPMRWGGAILPHEPTFVQPRPKLAVDAAQWGTPST